MTVDQTLIGVVMELGPVHALRDCPAQPAGMSGFEPDLQCVVNGRLINQFRARRDHMTLPWIRVSLRVEPSSLGVRARSFPATPSAQGPHTGPPKTSRSV